MESVSTLITLALGIGVNMNMYGEYQVNTGLISRVSILCKRVENCLAKYLAE